MGTLPHETDLSDEFPLDASVVYLNHAAVAPWPKRTALAVEKFARENIHFGATHYDRWLKQESDLRKQLAQLIGAEHPTDIALQKNTSEGLSVIAYGLPWQAGDEIVITDQEFPSNRIVWESLAHRGVRVKIAALDADDPQASIIACLSPATRLVSVSSVQYGTGLKLDLARIGQACRQNKTLFCVDAIQSLGACPFDLKQCQADFVVADGHKWMLGPEGIALLYVDPVIREQMDVNEYGWHMVENAGDYSRTDWTIARSARRFECGSPNMLGAIALSASLSLLLETGMEAVQTRIEQRVSYLMKGLQALHGLRILSPTAIEQRAGILTFNSERVSNDLLFNALKSQGVVCAQRGGGIRFSPHFYTPIDTLDRAIEAVTRAIT